MFLKLTAVSAVAAVAAAAGPQVPADFLGSEHRYVLAASDEFDSAALGGWDKKLGDWLGTAPGAFDDRNADTINGKLRLTAKEQPGFKPGELDEDCECGLQEISTGIVVSSDTYKHGFFEIGASMADASVLSSFWLQGTNGEINVVDVSNTPTAGRNVSHNFHCFQMGTDGSGTTSAPGEPYNHAAVNPDFDPAAFNTYGIHWDATGVTYFINGEQVGDTLSAACLDEEMNVVLSMETIASDVPSPFGQHSTKVNYFRHYSIEETTTTTTTTTTEEPALGVCDDPAFAFDSNPKAPEGVCASAKPAGKCFKKLTAASAQNKCAAAGARLCSAAEVQAGVAKTLAKQQCKVHFKPVWTSTDCETSKGKPGTLVTRGDGKNKAKDACVALTSKKAKKALLCCGDDGPSVGMMKANTRGGSRPSASDSGGGNTGGDGGSSGGSSSTGTAGGTAAGAVGGLICVVAILGVAIHRHRATAAAADAPTRRASLASVASEAGNAGRRYSGDLTTNPLPILAMEPTQMATSDLESDNGFVLDTTGNLRVASVTRGNPMYRNSVHLAAGDQVGVAGIAEASDM